MNKEYIILIIVIVLISMEIRHHINSKLHKNFRNLEKSKNKEQSENKERNENKKQIEEKERNEEEEKKLNDTDNFLRVTKNQEVNDINNGHENTKKQQIKVEKPIETNKTMFQYFEWHCSNDGVLWRKVKDEAKELSEVGITSLWLPPAYKATDGINDVGYGVYDLYDLGEFDQKGTVRTKYGTKEEYLEAINEAHKNNIEIYADIVLNHKAGGDASERVYARPVSENNRNYVMGDKREIEAYTVFNFPGRGDTYSSYKWTAKDFTGVDFDGITREKRIFKFDDKEWESKVDPEKGNYDYLMFNDIDMNNSSVVEELKKWGKWYIDETKIDGVRLDAIKHIKFSFFKEWLEYLRNETGKDFFALGEYWSGDINRLNYYMDESGHSMSLFDVPLHYNFQSASNSCGYFDMKRLKDNTFLRINPDKAITFVDNHDTQPGQALESWVQPWFKPLAYTFILTREEGYPCVFYGDYYGIQKNNFGGLKSQLDIILKTRKYYAYGKQHDYIDDRDVIGWTREGSDEFESSGLAAIITDSAKGSKRMYVGIKHAKEVWIDVTGNIKDKITIDESGHGVFNVADGSHSIWVNENKIKI